MPRRDRRRAASRIHRTLDGRSRGAAGPGTAMANSRGGVAAISTTGHRSTIAVRPPVAASAAAAPNAAAGTAMTAPSSIIAVRSWSPPAPRARARAWAADRRSAIEPAASASTARMTPSGPATRSASSAVVSVTRAVTSSRSDASWAENSSVSPENSCTAPALTSRICSARRGTSSNATSSIISGYQALMRALANVSERATVDSGSRSTSAV